MSKKPEVILQSRFYKLTEIAEATGLSSSTVRRACLDGELPYFRTARGASAAIRVLGSDFLEWIEGCRNNKRVLSPRETADIRKGAGDDND